MEIPHWLGKKWIRFRSWTNALVLTESPVAVRAYREEERRPHELARAISEIAMAERWKIEELHTEEGRLDEVFRSITRPETKPARFRMSEATMRNARGRDRRPDSATSRTHERVAAHFHDRETRSDRLLRLAGRLRVHRDFSAALGIFHVHGRRDFSSAGRPTCKLSSPGIRGCICFLFRRSGCACGRRNAGSGTIELLLTMPITPWQAIVGKFLASWLVLALALALTFPIVITVNYLGHPDNGVILGSYVGSLLLAGAYLSVAAMTSAMTRNQVVSFIVSVVICLFLILAGWSPVMNLLTQLGQSVVGANDRGLQRHDSFREHPKRRDRFARHPVFPVDHRLLTFHHQRDHSRASRRLRTQIWIHEKETTRDVSLFHGRRSRGRA